MVYHGYCHPSFILADIIPILKESKTKLSDSDEFRSIAIINLHVKIIDHIIIEKQSEVLKTYNYQVRFKTIFEQFLAVFFFFFEKKIPIVVVRDVCPSVRPCQ